MSFAQTLPKKGHRLCSACDLHVSVVFCCGRPCCCSFSFRELLARIRALLRRRQLDAGAPSADAVIQIGAVALDHNTRRVTRHGEPVNLSPREFALLSYLMEHAGPAISRQELADAVWGENWVGTPRTVDVHVRWLREKLEDDPSNPSLIETVYSFGYLIRRP